MSHIPKIGYARYASPDKEVSVLSNTFLLSSSLKKNTYMCHSTLTLTLILKMGIKADILGLYITECVFCDILTAIHIYIFILETILWPKRAAKTFRLSQSTVV